MEKRRYDVTLSKADYAVGLSQAIGQLARRDTGRQRMLFARLAAYIAIIMFIAVAFPRGANAVFIAVLLFWVAEGAIQAAFKTQTIGISFEPEVQGHTNVELSDDGIIEEGALRTRRWTWDALRRVHQPSGYVVLEFIGWDIITLPDRIWTDSDERSALIAELVSRQATDGVGLKSVSIGGAEARFKLVEPVLIARLFVAVETFQLIFDGALRLGRRPGPPAPLIALAAALVGTAIVWWASGRAFRRLEARSPTLALRVAWGVTILLAAAFALWFLRVI
jgi:hypothetical protein